MWHGKRAEVEEIGRLLRGWDVETSRCREDLTPPRTGVSAHTRRQPGPSARQQECCGLDGKAAVCQQKKRQIKLVVYVKDVTRRAKRLRVDRRVGPAPRKGVNSTRPDDQSIAKGDQSGRPGDARLVRKNSRGDTAKSGQ
ncbi:hypothetical protein N7539_000988 [Penicillium diatomitis]|uniref:Uncharacterized protein n=1 Tax=Penicillium diatomitis TaxID=2819901 RepID=A0A9W9XMR3_9EURO|nr:uncharacterized protein N7539_000988 [Penicillium diatomitis]KAJ5495872.1 hypothetical protein N7539_000988 [Penicillium diatomitis]